MMDEPQSSLTTGEIVVGVMILLAIYCIARLASLYGERGAIERERRERRKRGRRR
jgi:hypothetical protein